MLAIDQIRDVLEQNLLEQWGISARAVPVFYGTHLVKRVTQAPRIVVGLRPRSVTGPAMGDHAPGPGAVDEDDNVARMLYTRSQDFGVWVRGPAAPREIADTDVVRWEQAACAELAHQVTASLWEAAGGGCAPDGAIVVQDLEWLTLESADLRSGAELVLGCVARIPMLDAPRTRLRLTLPNTTTATYAVGGDGITEQLVALVGPPLPP